MNLVNLDKICRICGGIFYDTSKTIADHGEQIYKYLPIKFQDNINGFPRRICEDCAFSIDSWNDFYKRCVTTQQKFNKIFRKERDITLHKGRISDDNKSEDTVSLSNKITKSNTYLHQFVGEDDQNKNRIQFPSFICEFCSAPFKLLNQLNDHLGTNHNQKIFCCDICKVVQPRENLINHMTKHALKSIKQKTPFDCMNNGTSAPDLYRRDSDKTIGSAKCRTKAAKDMEKELPCVEGENKFPSSLKRIRSAQSAEKLFKCNFCDKEFRTESKLIRHHRTHFKVTPYKCPSCKKEFRFKHSLKHHSCDETTAGGDGIQQKKDGKMTEFKCLFCGMNLHKKRALREHLKKIHGESMKYYTGR